MARWIQTSEFCKNSEVFCRKNLHEGCETLSEMGNCEIANGNKPKLFR